MAVKGVPRGAALIGTPTAIDVSQGGKKLRRGIKVFTVAVDLPEPARDADAVAAGIALSAVAGTVAANYQTCHENAEQLRALQAWVSEMASTTK